MSASDDLDSLVKQLGLDDSTAAVVAARVRTLRRELYWKACFAVLTRQDFDDAGARDSAIHRALQFVDEAEEQIERRIT